MSGVYRESPFERIVEVGWGGRFGLINFTELDGGDDLVVPFAAASPPFAVPPVLGGVRSVGEVIDLAPWNADPGLAGVLSIDVTGAMFHGQLVNFRRLEQDGSTGAVGGDAFFLSPAHNYAAELKIFTGGTITVSSVVGRHPHFTLTGGTLHYTGSREYELHGPLDGIFHTFNRDGYI